MPAARPARCGRGESAPAPKRVQPLDALASADGPLLLSGGVRVVAADGTVLYEGERAALCRCGQSGNKPFCDGTHKKVGFKA